MTADELKRCMPYANQVNCEKFATHITEAMADFGIDTPLRKAYFLAQLAHESGSLQYVKEIATGGAYEGRKDLGNTEPGDGVRYKGRGLIQITGKANYKTCGDALGVDLVGNPDLLETPALAAASAGWFWATHNLNASADSDDIKTNTRKINGGFTGLQDRIERLTDAKRGLCIL